MIFNLLIRLFFCIPSEIVNRICNIMSKDGEKLIFGNKLNENFFKYLETERILNEYQKNPDGSPPFTLRHR